MLEVYSIKMMMMMTFVKKLNICLLKMVLNMKKSKKLMSVKIKKEYASVIHQVIEQEEVVNCDVNYYEVNYEYEKLKKLFVLNLDHA